MITFAFVATHNRFVLDRGGKVFNRTAPVIKLPHTVAEEEHLGLIGLLNGSTACFWMKQSSFNNGTQGVNEGSKAEQWEWFVEHDGTKLKAFPLASNRPLALARALDSEAQRHASHLLSALLCPRNPAPTRAPLDVARGTAASLRRRQIALQEELDWQVYRLYGLFDNDLTYTADGGLDTVPEVALGERAFEIVLARAMAAGEVETKWFERHGSTPVSEIPERWPAAYRALVERRIAAIATNPNIALIEKPEYRRRWAQEPWDDMEKRALRYWLLDRLEEPRCWPLDEAGAPSLQSAVQLCDRVRHDEEFRRVAELYAGRPDVDLEKLVADLALEEAVPYLAAFRYTADGLRKRAVWERTWDLQRREDGGEKLDTPVPPKYAREDFRKGSYWSLRGKLDVPKERFVNYPEASRAADPSPRPRLGRLGPPPARPSPRGLLPSDEDRRGLAPRAPHHPPRRPRRAPPLAQAVARRRRLGHRRAPRHLVRRLRLRRSARAGSDRGGAGGVETTGDRRQPGSTPAQSPIEATSAGG